MTAADTENRLDLACSFCGKARSEVAKLIAGPGVFICNECVGLCNDILALKDEQTGESPEYSVKSWEQFSDEELLDYLPKVAAISAQVEHQLARWVRLARSRGMTWTRIGESLGMTRQSAWERFSGED